MELRGICSAPIGFAAGAGGFFKPTEYWYHRPWSPLKWAGLTTKRMRRTSKTMTLLPTKGNMPMQEDGITPKEWKPACIVIRPFQGITLNAVGLANPGAHSLFSRNTWQQQDSGPFRLSFMAPIKHGESMQDRLDQYREFTDLFLRQQPHTWRSPVGIELNGSCPNTDGDSSHLVNEMGQALDIVGKLGIPILCKFNATDSVRAVAEIAQHRECDAITMSNAIPWGRIPYKIDWEGLFGTTTSPLAHLGGGGLSGWPLQQVVYEWIEEAMDCSFPKPISACGGINSAKAVQRFSKLPIVREVQVGIAPMVNFWRMRSIIRTAYELF